MKRVESRDGTSIAYEVTGQGPPLVLVGGAFRDRHARAAVTPLAEHLAGRFTVYSYDRRGRGDSGDTPPWSVAREVEDLAALVTAAGGRAALHGMSSGAILALEAALGGVPATQLVLYEAPVGFDAAHRPPEGLAEELAALAASGKRSEAAALFLTRLVGMPEPAVAGMQRAPTWRDREALAHTLAHDVRLASGSVAAVEQARALTTPTLVLDGSASPPWMREASARLAATLPAARHVTLAGQTHDVDPAALARAIAAFLGD